MENISLFKENKEETIDELRKLNLAMKKEIEILKASLLIAGNRLYSYSGNSTFTYPKTFIDEAEKKLNYKGP